LGEHFVKEKKDRISFINSARNNRLAAKKSWMCVLSNDSDTYGISKKNLLTLKQYVLGDCFFTGKNSVKGPI